jgi:hypothetical protein
MDVIQDSLDQAMKINGAVGAALVDYSTGMCLGSVGGGGLDLELAAAGNTEVVRAKKNIRDQLGINERIEDILITLESQYHLIRMSKNSKSIFYYLVLDKDKANLALARMTLKKIDQGAEMPAD